LLSATSAVATGKIIWINKSLPLICIPHEVKHKGCLQRMRNSPRRRSCLHIILPRLLQEPLAKALDCPPGELHSRNQPKVWRSQGGSSIRQR
jgi:hypothetical protein